MIIITLYIYILYKYMKTVWYLFGLSYDCKKNYYCNLLYSFGAPGTAYRRSKKLTSFNNNTLSRRIQNDLASWMFRILSPFDFQKIDCGKAPEVLS